jgi:hypothetical protein
MVGFFIWFCCEVVDQIAEVKFFFLPTSPYYYV